MDQLFAEAVQLLKDLITIPSFSKEEDGTAAVIAGFFEQRGIACLKKGNNIWAANRYFDPAKPTVLLNSHHDTVKPNAGWTRDPHTPEIIEGKLYGLGSNDAGGCLVSLMAVFLYYYRQEDLAYNLIFAATAEEEISGANGIESILADLGEISFAIMGEPTLMHMAIAEKGLLVIDGVVYGKPGHAAREEGDNAIYKALADIAWFRDYRFEKISSLLGTVKMTVTAIHAGQQHNVVPGECRFTVDIRLNERYTHEEVLGIIRHHVNAEITPRSTRIRPSSISPDHPIVQAGISLGKPVYGSPTTSDQALIPFPSVKMGPGDSARSHTADEYIYLEEIENGVRDYIALLDTIMC